MNKSCIRQNSHSVKPSNQHWLISRRAFLRSAVATAAGSGVLSLSCSFDNFLPRRRDTFDSVRFGIVTDCHYADIDTIGSRFYRQSLNKLSECTDLMNAEGVDFLIELGDFKDQDKPPDEQKTLAYLDDVEAVFQQFDGPAFHVLGNHDMDSLSKQQFLAHVTNPGIATEQRYYSYDVKGLHCIVLDANYKSDGSNYDHGNFMTSDINIPAHELNWLIQDLAVAQSPVIVFIHQLLDGTGSVYVKNAAEVRRILQASDKVLAVFQGHYHPGKYSEIEGIHYYTLKAVVNGTGEENNSYAIVEVRPDLDITVTGYRRATSMQLTQETATVPQS